MSEPPPMPDGRKCVRTIRFERSEGTDSKLVKDQCRRALSNSSTSASIGKVHTVVNLYVLNGVYDGVFRWGTVCDTSLNGGNIE